MDLINPSVEGFLLINKPPGLSSFNCIYRIRKIVGKNAKVGHAGTLDPFATGLLVIGVGRPATRQLHTGLKRDKEYVAKGKLGEITDTLDCTGSVTKCCKKPVTKEKLLAAIQQLGSSYQQTPPIYSARKHRGQRLYKLARENEITPEELAKITERKKKTVQLHSISLLDVAPPYFTIKAHVSHGTYIRSLVNDIARKADSYATTHELERTRIGTIDIKDAIDLDQLKTIQDIEKHLIGVQEFLERYT